jgi:hypothetical protein
MPTESSEVLAFISQLQGRRLRTEPSDAVLFQPRSQHQVSDVRWNASFAPEPPLADIAPLSPAPARPRSETAMTRPRAPGRSPWWVAPVLAGVALVGVALGYFAFAGDGKVEAPAASIVGVPPAPSVAPLSTPTTVAPAVVAPTETVPTVPAVATAPTSATPGRHKSNASLRRVAAKHHAKTVHHTTVAATSTSTTATHAPSSTPSRRQSQAGDTENPL